MLSRLISRSCSHLRLLTLISSNTSPPPLVPLSSPPPPIFSNPKPYFSLETHRCFSSNNGGGDSEDPKISCSSSWNITSKDDENDIFGDDSGDLTGISDSTSVGFDAAGSNKGLEDSWTTDDLTPKKGDIFDGIEKDFGSVEASGGGDEWETAEGYKPWSFDDEEKTTEIFYIGDVPQGIQHVGGDDSAEREMHAAENAQLEKEKAELTVQLKGPNRAFGDLIAASGITDVMLESLILLKDLDGVEGLPPLTEIEDIRLEKNERKSSRAEIERKKQEEIAKSRVRQVDDKGRAYGTGRRKCSIARVWIQPGEGKFIVNDKHFDTYFPILDHRADLLRPFMETKTLGLWDVACTVKGGGVSGKAYMEKITWTHLERRCQYSHILKMVTLDTSFGIAGQVGAVRLGISRALQNWEPGLRPNLRSAGFLTRDSRVVERKKPGKAKARKSFQWVKR